MKGEQMSVRRCIQVIHKLNLGGKASKWFELRPSVKNGAVNETLYRT